MSNKNNKKKTKQNQKQSQQKATKQQKVISSPPTRSIRSSVLPSSFRFKNCHSPFEFDIPSDLWPIILNLENGKLSDGFGLATSCKWGYNSFWDAVWSMSFGAEMSATKIQHLLCRCSTKNLRSLSIQRFFVAFERFENLQVPTFTRLEELHLNYFKHFDSSYLSNFSSFPYLRKLTLNLPGRSLSDGLPSLLTLTRLMELTLVGEFAFAELSSLQGPYLSYLHLHTKTLPYFPTEDAHILSRLPSLTTLIIGGVNISNSTLEVIVTSATNLQTFQFAPCEFTQRTVDILSKLPQLTHLTLNTPGSSIGRPTTMKPLVNLQYLCSSYIYLVDPPEKIQRIDLLEVPSLPIFEQFIHNLLKNRPSLPLLGVAGSDALPPFSTEIILYWTWLENEDKRLAKSRINYLDD